MVNKLRVLVAAAITVSVSFFGLTTAQAAVTHGPTLVSTAANLERMIPMDDGRSLLIWRDGAGINKLVSSVVNLDGTIEPAVNIYAPSSTSPVELAATDAWTKLPDGSIALTWVTRVEGPYSIDTQVMVAISDDGSEWNAPVVVSTSAIDTRFNDKPDCPRCGHANSQIASDGFGRLALQFSYDSGARTDWGQGLTTSINGKDWTPITWATGHSFDIEGGTIIGLPSGGFIGSWIANWGGQFMNRYAVRMNGSITSTWQITFVIAHQNQLNYGGQLLLTSPTEVALVYVDGNNTSRYAVDARRYSITTKKWAPEQRLIVSGAADYLNGDVATSVASDGTVSAALVVEQSTGDTLHVNSFKGSRVGTDSTVLTQTATGMVVHKLIPNPSGSVSIVYSSGTAGVRIYTPGDSTGNLDVPFDSGIAGEVQVAVAASGTAFMGANVNNVAKVVTVERSAAPLAAAAPSVTGVAKTGVTLKSAAVVFNSISGTGLNSIQWYACSAAVPANTTVVPSTCVAIAKATAPNFKVTAKQKGKFITVAVTNTNQVGAATVLAPSLTKAK